jgi:TRAP-type C4-dicarboxylate transport system permease small subunit
MNPAPTPPPTAWPERLAGWAETLAMAALLAMATLVVLQVVARDGFHLGLAWADELARYAGLTIVYLTAPLLLLNNKHVLVDILINVLAGRLRGAVDLLNEALMALFCAMFLWGGWVFMQRAGKFSTPALGMPNLVFYTPVMAGMVLLFAASLVRLVRHAARLRRGDLSPQQGGTPLT